MKTKLVLIISIILITISCSFFENMFDADEYHNLSTDKKFKYNTGDTLVFKDNQDDKDTFVVESLQTDYRVSDKTYFYQYQQINLECLDTTLSKRNTIYFESNFFEINWLNYYTLQYLDKIKSSNIEIDGIIMKNAYDIDNSLIFQYQNGILKYKKYDKIYELIIQ